jgi:hypothetical protein
MSVSLTGQDAISVDGRILNDFADNDFGVLDFPEDLANVKRAKNGNTIYALREMGALSDLTLRVLVGSSDDKYLQSRLQQQRNDFSNFVLVAASISKRVGDGNGNMTTVVYQCSNGIFKRIPNVKSSAEGDVEQSVAIWQIKFGNNSRTIQ